MSGLGQLFSRSVQIAVDAVFSSLRVDTEDVVVSGREKTTGAGAGAGAGDGQNC